MLGIGIGKDVGLARRTGAGKLRQGRAGTGRLSWQGLAQSRRPRRHAGLHARLHARLLPAPLAQRLAPGFGRGAAVFRLHGEHGGQPGPPALLLPVQGMQGLLEERERKLGLAEVLLSLKGQHQGAGAGAPARLAGQRPDAGRFAEGKAAPALPREEARRPLQAQRLQRSARLLQDKIRVCQVQRAGDAGNAFGKQELGLQGGALASLPDSLGEAAEHGQLFPVRGDEGAQARPLRFRRGEDGPAVEVEEGPVLGKEAPLLAVGNDLAGRLEPGSQALPGVAVEAAAAGNDAVLPGIAHLEAPDLALQPAAGIPDLVLEQDQGALPALGRRAAGPDAGSLGGAQGRQSHRVAQPLPSACAMRGLDGQGQAGPLLDVDGLSRPAVLLQVMGGIP